MKNIDVFKELIVLDIANNHYGSVTLSKTLLINLVKL